MDFQVEPRIYRLRNQVQHYAWGPRGPEGLIPQLLGIASEVGAETHVAELWLGAHSKAPSRVLLDGASGAGLPLDELVAAQPLAVLGAEIAERFEAEWPFLLKVLSAAEPLSIQVHPNREQAQALHSRDPEHYPDSNHKPEIAIALSGLEALAGLKRPIEVQRTLAVYPALAAFVGLGTGEAVATAADVHQILERTVGRAEAQPSALTSTLDAISQRLTVEGREDPEARLFLGLRQRYPGPEVGLVFSLLMNHTRLAPGEAIFIPAGVPHAYLFGDIVECMANSDNVVRAGLTGKHRDRETLLAVLSDELGPPPTIGASPQPMQEYRTPAAEFEVWRLRADGSPRPMLTGERPEMLLVTAGKAIASWDGRSSGRICLARGESALVPACLACYTLDIGAGGEIFRATVPTAGG